MYNSESIQYKIWVDTCKHSRYSPFLDHTFRRNFPLYTPMKSLYMYEKIEYFERSEQIRNSQCGHDHRKPFVENRYTNRIYSIDVKLSFIAIQANDMGQKRRVYLHLINDINSINGKSSILTNGPENRRGGVTCASCGASCLPNRSNLVVNKERLHLYWNAEKPTNVRFPFHSATNEVILCRKCLFDWKELLQHTLNKTNNISAQKSFSTFKNGVKNTIWQNPNIKR